MKTDMAADRSHILQEKLSVLNTEVLALREQLGEFFEVRRQHACNFDGSLTCTNTMIEPLSPVITMHTKQSLNGTQPQCDDSTHDTTSVIDEFMSFEQYLQHKSKQASQTTKSHLSTLLLKESFDEFIFQDVE